MDANAPLARTIPALLPARRDDRCADDWLCEDLCHNASDLATVGDLLEVSCLNNRFIRLTNQHRIRSSIEASALIAGLVSAMIALVGGFSPLVTGLAGLLGACASGFTAMTGLWTIAGFNHAYGRQHHGARHG